ncbi:lectin-like protein [Merismopedia glauca]|uniref:C-type lectin domain-containing protein n=1 Tax=Merismopedia glauca CCAP 1448/3 TaxID=1296344 RepID=A0A2T1C1E4_9CYAN|nr:lectin-like protein [Merismopedia glauca]PSB01977.1 hypothetical protein C7B64_15545 [Merismopedia glauca CCAP 1448/3]
MPVKTDLIVVKSLLGSVISLIAVMGAGVVQAATFNFNSHKYFLTDSFGSWTKAQTQAEKFGGYLVTISSQAEQNFLIESFGGSELLWIGFSDRLIEGEFTWINGEAVSYTNWAVGEPNNELVFGGEDYAAMNWRKPGEWNDLPDDVWKRQLRGIIEVPLAHVPEPSTVLGTMALGVLGISYWRKRQGSRN